MKFHRNVFFIDNMTALAQIMAWHRTGDKPLSGAMLVCCTDASSVTRPQSDWGLVKNIYNIESILIKSSLVQIMAWCHQSSSHYLNHWWFITISAIRKENTSIKFHQKCTFFFQENAFVYVVWAMLAILFRLQYIVLSHAWVWKRRDLGRGIQSCGYHGP